MKSGDDAALSTQQEDSMSTHIFTETQFMGVTAYQSQHVSELEWQVHVQVWCTLSGAHPGEGAYINGEISNMAAFFCHKLLNIVTVDTKHTCSRKSTMFEFAVYVTVYGIACSLAGSMSS